MEAPRKMRFLLAALTVAVILLAAAAGDVAYRARFAHAPARRIKDVQGGQVSEVETLAQVLAVGGAIEDTQDIPVLHNAGRGSGRMRYQVVFLRIMTGLYRGRVAATQNVLHFSPAHNVLLRRGSLVRVCLDAEAGRFRSCEILKPAVRVVDLTWMVAAFLAAGVLALGLRGAAFTASFLLTGVASAFVLAPMASGRLPVGAGLAIYVAAVSVICLCLVGTVGRKALAAVAGAAVGIATGGGVVWLVHGLLDLSGLENTYAIFLQQALGERAASFNFPDLLVCGAVITILGLALDLGVSVASGMEHVAREDPSAGRKKILAVGLGLSRDITGTMILTLLFVWLGVRVHILLLPWVLGVTPRELVNSESLSAEVLRVSAGTMGLIVTGPVTALAGMLLLSGRGKRRKPERPPIFHRAGLWGLAALLAVAAFGLAWFIHHETEAAGGPPLIWKWQNLSRPEPLHEVEALERAEEYMRAGSLDKAAWLLWGVRNREAVRGWARRDLARIYAARRWFVLAESEILTALARLPRDSETHYIAGIVDAWRDRPESARRHLEKAIELDPANNAAAESLRALFGPER